MDKGVALGVRQSDREEPLEAERVPVATGRTPNTKALGLAEAGVAQPRNGGIEVDERMRTTRPGTYAAGDVTGLDQFAYMAAHGANIAARNPLNGDALASDKRVMPAAVLSDPQAARGWRCPRGGRQTRRVVGRRRPAWTKDATAIWTWMGAGAPHAWEPMLPATGRCWTSSITWRPTGPRSPPATRGTATLSPTTTGSCRRSCLPPRRWRASDGRKRARAKPAKRSRRASCPSTRCRVPWQPVTRAGSSSWWRTQQTTDCSARISWRPREIGRAHV